MRDTELSTVSNSARTTNWGNTAGVDTVAGTGTGSNQIIYVYAQVLTGQFVAPGTYTDTISSATASFTVTAVVQATCDFRQPPWPSAPTRALR